MPTNAIDNIVEVRGTPKPSGARPKVTKNNRRMVVVCPYDSFNTYFNYTVPEALKIKGVDIVRDATRDCEPYIDVRERERGRVRPDYVIDFGSLIVNGNPTCIVDFLGYREWARRQGGIVLLSIKGEVHDRLTEKHSFDDRRNFMQGSVGKEVLQTYRGRIERDLEMAAKMHPKNEDLEFFDVRYI